MLSTQDKVNFHLLGGKFYPKNRFYYALNEAELLEQISLTLPLSEQLVSLMV